MADTLEKGAGEGSRGGKVIGHTASGKPIYAPSAGAQLSPAHFKHYTAADHADAEKVHTTQMKHHEDRASHHEGEHDARYREIEHLESGRGHGPKPEEKGRLEKLKAEATHHAERAGRHYDMISAHSDAMAHHYDSKKEKGKEPSKQATYGKWFPHADKFGEHSRAATDAKEAKDHDKHIHHLERAKHHVTNARNEARKLADVHGGAHEAAQRYHKEISSVNARLRRAKKAKEKAAMKKGDVAMAAFEALEKAGAGEGSRGGNIIGHTSSGKPIYRSARKYMRGQHERTGALKHAAMRGTRLSAAFEKQHKGWSVEDHTEAMHSHDRAGARSQSAAEQTRVGAEAEKHAMMRSHHHKMKQAHDLARHRKIKGLGKGDAMSAFDQLESFAKSGGPYIGPKGGKWANPQHTIPWDEKREAGGKAQMAHKDHDEHGARELHLYTENDGDLHRQQHEPIRRNLVNKMAEGKYEHHKAAKLFGYLADSASKKYAKDHGSGKGHQFDPATRRAAAKAMADQFHDEATAGDHDHLLQKKHIKARDKTKKAHEKAKAAFLAHPGAAKDPKGYEAAKAAMDESGRAHENVIRGQRGKGAIPSKAEDRKEGVHWGEGRSARRAVAKNAEKGHQLIVSHKSGAVSRYEHVGDEGYKKVGGTGPKGVGKVTPHDEFHEHVTSDRVKHVSRDDFAKKSIDEESDMVKSRDIDSWLEANDPMQKSLDEIYDGSDADEGGQEDLFEKGIVVTPGGSVHNQSSGMSGGMQLGQPSQLPSGSTEVSSQKEGGKLEGTGKTSGSNTPKGVPGEESPGKGKKQKLSEDDDDENQQMKPGKKPLERSVNKSFDASPNGLDRDRAYADAVVAGQLQKSHDTQVGVPGAPPPPEPEPMVKARVWDQGSGATVLYSNAADLAVEQYLEKGESVELGPQRAVVNQGQLCKSCNGHFAAMLSACPHCGDGTATAVPVPGRVLEKSSGRNPVLRRPPMPADVKVGRPD